MTKMYILLFILSFALLCSCNTIVPFIKACKLNEEDCLLTANMQIAYPYIANGIPEIGVPPTDPMNFENLTMWADQDNFKFMLPHLQIRGGRRCRVVEFRQLRDESAMKFTVDCPMIGTGSYKFNGKMFIFDIDKEGDFRMETNSLRTTITAKFDKIVINGKNYWKLLTYEFFSEPRESMNIDLAGLFSGDVEQVQPLMNIINKDWMTIWQVGEPIDSGIVKNIFSALKAFFIRVPIDEFMQY
ncbi:PREDICTED: circadian clock-controlled protein-like [Papilio polytes]|uniref:JHBP like protein n=1 Tax=Papilio polytes TaxID=76194 RepID=A0A679FE47_PAPPL|nr:PREDICTED: circadian clock-controlled protein-like [Papilio polytes]BBV14738.1 JHBP like protein [Papilio polytes]